MSNVWGDIRISLTSSFNYKINCDTISLAPLGSKQGDHGFCRPGGEQPILHPGDGKHLLQISEAHQISSKVKALRFRENHVTFHNNLLDTQNHIFTICINMLWNQNHIEPPTTWTYLDGLIGDPDRFTEKPSRSSQASPCSPGPSWSVLPGVRNGGSPQESWGVPQ